MPDSAPPPSDGLLDELHANNAMLVDVVDEKSRNKASARFMHRPMPAFTSFDANSLANVPPRSTRSLSLDARIFYDSGTKARAGRTNIERAPRARRVKGYGQ